MDALVSTLVLAAKQSYFLVSHEGSENLAVLGELLHQAPVQINILPASSHGATEIYQLFTARHVSLSECLVLQFEKFWVSMKLTSVNKGQVRITLKYRNTNIVQYTLHIT